ncbi:diaminopimelate decarboxylase [Candidatus Omnitrophus magneticus]|uniref:Diaminopimelate decarboxylase n=1 Tax=Candidatus Omnitrophus magneticus TaxID=1609969 RepID=A0A0F0CUF5_9BACT|nr:diaminopimelate decarboxylase [Candidatus Omnitrophus magneticus]
MNEFKYKGNILYCEDVSILDIVKDYSTPFYLYSHRTIVDHFLKIKNAFSAIDPLICFSMKANSNLNICKALLNEGCGLDIVSGGELYKALKIGCPPSKIVYASVGKTEEEIETAIRKKIFSFNVESIPELIMIDTVARRLKTKPRVALRVNPDVKPDTHDYITTGTKEKKFGIDFKTAEDIFDNANKYSNVSIKGLHVHIGSQITDVEPFITSLKKVLDFVEKGNIGLEWLNIGGGFGIMYHDESAKTAEDFARAIIPILKARNLKIILEPGRFIVGSGGILVCKVLYVKTGVTGKNFAIIDAGMNDLIRPSLYKAYHEVLPVAKLDTTSLVYDVVGPICESGDYLALDRSLPKLSSGEYLAVMSAGAYGYTMASNYNSRPRPAEIMVIDGHVKIIRRAETYKNLIAGERIIKELK